MNIKKELLTKKNFEELKIELNNLKNFERENIILEIKRTRKRGDLSENSEYQIAREKQKLLDEKIFEIEKKINNCEIIDSSLNINKNKITFLSTIKLKNLNNNNITNYKIVGSDEENLEKGFISIESPIAKILIGKSINEIITLKKFNKIVKYIILDINF